MRGGWMLGLGVGMAPVAMAVPPATAEWRPVSEHPVRVECTDYAGQPWCRSTGVVAAPALELAGAFRDAREDADTFGSVRSIRQVAENTFHVTMDFPGAFSDRDYVAEYSHHREGLSEVYAWKPVVSEHAPVEDAVRLVNMAGEWRFQPLGDATLVTYLWQADLGGDFPAWAESTARKRVGHEALRDIARARDARLSAPTK